MKFDRSPPEDAAIAQGLASLKRQGGTVLVVGAATTAHADACERFLGDADHEHVFVRTDRTVRPEEESSEAAAVIERPVLTRSASSDTTRTSAFDTEMLSADIGSAMRAAADDADSVRVCFDSLRPLIDGVDRPSLISLLNTIREIARETGSVVHFHLPALADGVPAGLFDAVDAIVELNGQGHATYQQWHLPESGKTSEWIEI
ncbi:DUF7504 family protein [Natronomonas sp.]|uniref:DUF7504 family protein n=1 Tax=Natronomonas sp. TaxID=2184060 RepID=UPI002FC2A83E